MAGFDPPHPALMKWVEFTVSIFLVLFSLVTKPDE